MTKELEQKYVARNCPKCGNQFVCTGDSNCWCMEIVIPKKVQDYIASHFEECLCKECIFELIKKLE
jgi:hypothetical protein